MISFLFNKGKEIIRIIINGVWGKSCFCIFYYGIDNLIYYIMRNIFGLLVKYENLFFKDN